MPYKEHAPAGPALLGYDPWSELPEDHLARLVDKVVDSVEVPEERSGLGQSGYHPHLLAKVLLYAYATGVFSSRRMDANCGDSLAYLYLTRGSRPSYHVLSDSRTLYKDLLERVWLALLATASSEGMPRVGRIDVDATRIKANSSGDLVISAADYDELIDRLTELLERSREVDARESEEGVSVKTQTGVDASKVQIRTVVRSLGKEAPVGEISPKMLVRLDECVKALETAKKSELKHVSLSDPDARFMPIGASKWVSMGHALEVAADSGLLVAGGTTNAPIDTGRLSGLVEAAKAVTGKVDEVAADSGYFDANQLVELMDSGVNVVVPDATTASNMRRGEFPDQSDRVQFERMEDRDAYRCPQGNVLTLRRREPNGRAQYEAVRSCRGCPLADKCLQRPNARRRTIWVRSQAERITPYLAGFADPSVQAKYYARGPGVETVFALLKRILGFRQWSVRGSDKVAAEASLLKCAYQVRKLQSWTTRAA
jgi:transposase